MEWLILVNVNIKIAEIDNIRIANYGKENIVFNSIILLKSSISKYIGETIMERNILGELLILKHINNLLVCLGTYLTSNCHLIPIYFGV